MLKSRKISQILIVFVIITLTTSNPPYEAWQPLREPQGQVMSTAISNDNSIIVNGGYDNIVNIYFYDQQMSRFQHTQTLNESNDDVENVAITGDGKFILVTDYSGRALVYKLNETTLLFDLFQDIVLQNYIQTQNSQSYGGAISEDHQWVIASIGNHVLVFNYNQSLAQFTLNQTIEHLHGIVRHIQLSDDLFMTVNTIQNYLYIYNFGTEFALKQRIQASFMQPDRSFLSSNHKYIIFSQYDYISSLLGRYNSFLHIAKYDEVTGFYKKYIQFTIVGTWINYASLSEDLSFLFISGAQSSILVSQPFGEPKVQQHMGVLFSQVFSQNQMFLITGGYGYGVVNRLNCNWNHTGGYILNQETGVCQSCGKGCLECQNLTSCAFCNENESYAFHGSSGECALCTQRSYIQDNQCFSCSENCQKCSSLDCETCAGGYFINKEKKCEVCSQNCLNCTQNTCLTCDQERDYAVDPSTGECKMCLQRQNNFVVDKKCLTCDIVGCQLCKSLQVCSFCKTSEGYFSTNDGKCQKKPKAKNCTSTEEEDCKKPCEGDQCNQGDLYWIIGVVFGLVAAIGVIVFVAWWLHKKRLEERGSYNDENDDKGNGNNRGSGSRKSGDSTGNEQLKEKQIYPAQIFSNKLNSLREEIIYQIQEGMK